MIKILNRDAKAVKAALLEVGRTRLPMPLALKMAKTQVKIDDELRATEIARVGLVASLANGSKEMDASHENWSSFVDGFNALMEQGFKVEGPFVLWHRPAANGIDEDAYSWHPSFKTLIPEYEPNVLADLWPLLNVKDAPAEEKESEPEKK